MEVDIEDGGWWHSPASAKFDVPIEDAVAVDRFAHELRGLEAGRRATAILGGLQELAW